MCKHMTRDKGGTKDAMQHRNKGNNGRMWRHQRWKRRTNASLRCVIRVGGGGTGAGGRRVIDGGGGWTGHGGWVGTGRRDSNDAGRGEDNWTK